MNSEGYNESIRSIRVTPYSMREGKNSLVKVKKFKYKLWFGFQSGYFILFLSWREASECD